MTGIAIPNLPTTVVLNLLIETRQKSTLRTSWLRSRTRVGKSRRACRTPAALSIAARGRTCPKGPENDLRTGSCADASAQSAMRHRRRRRKGGGDVREPQGDDVAQAGRDHEAQDELQREDEEAVGEELRLPDRARGGHPLRPRRRQLRGGRQDRGDVGQDPGGRRRRDGVRAQRPGHELLAGREAARAADDRAGRDTVRRRHPPEGELRGGQLRGKLRALLLGKAPCPLEHAEAGRAPMRMLREHGRRDVCCMCKRLS